jgi:phage terminase large subunit-like protein
VIRSFVEAMSTGEFTHDGDPDVTRHLGNAVRRELRWRDDEGKPLFCIQKERPDSLFKIDAGMAALLAYEAAGDAIKAGATTEAKKEFQMLFVGGSGRTS